jgi:quercetin dioxygenase-like cupin family protein
MESTPEVLRPLESDEGELLRLGSIDILVKEDGRSTRQKMAVAEFRGTAFKIPPHIHTEHDETIQVLEGTMGIMLGDKTFAAPAGSCFSIPVGVPHSTWNDTGKLVRFLNIIAPARYLEYFRELAMAARGGPPAPDAVKAVMLRYGLRPL